MYRKGYFCGGRNIDLNLIMCEDNIFIPSKLKIYVLHWRHTYLLHTVMDRTEANICQHLYWTNIRNVVQRELINSEPCQHTKLLNKKYGKLPAKLSEEISLNKICVNLIGPYVIIIKGKKENFHLKPLR